MTSAHGVQRKKLLFIFSFLLSIQCHCLYTLCAGQRVKRQLGHALSSQPYYFPFPSPTSLSPCCSSLLLHALFFFIHHCHSSYSSIYFSTITFISSVSSSDCLPSSLFSLYPVLCRLVILTKLYRCEIPLIYCTLRFSFSVKQLNLSSVLQEQYCSVGLFSLIHTC